jgi:hypothetical protein
MAGLDDARLELDAVFDEFLVKARGVIADNPDEDPFQVVFQHIWTASRHDSTVLIVVITHMVLRILEAENGQ